MADLFSTDNNLTIMRFEHQILVAQSNITARKIRIMELKEEILRCETDMEAQKKVISDAENNIKIHKDKDKDKESKEENK